ncbi:hypothetical protein [Oricola sp.]|uniref:Bug family tripartite tricarboxylate transporter substrate binding protein n=1 Tax=Oricola sp. TaxID=1979950 RepID=UPI0025E25633|nr:hypothetical protein [Oricola sp.]MCI5076742.1 hypothetical protein [Oricola sp.]
MKIIKRMFRSLTIAGAVAGLSVASAQTAMSDDITFEGQTVEIMVNFTAGGATDTAVRMLAPYVVKYLPGEPNVIVTNRAGAGGTAAIDYLIDSVAPDGMHIGYFSGTAIRWALGMQQVPEGTGDLPYVAGRSINQIIQVSTESGLTFDTLPGWDKPIFFSTNSPDNHVVARLRMLFNVLGVKEFQVISGYQTMGKMLAAIRAGESDMSQANDAFFGPNREAILGDGKITPLAQMGEYKDGRIVAQAGFEDIPVLDELWRKNSPETLDTPEYKAWEAIHVAMSIQHVFVLPPNTPEEYVSVWSDAILKGYADPDYIKQLTDTGTPVPASIGAEDVRKNLAQMKEMFGDPDVHAAIEGAIAENMK